MNQKMIDTLFSITIEIHENRWFGERTDPKKREDVQAWVAKQIAEIHGIYTIPSGASWGVITTKEKFDEYWKPIVKCHPKKCTVNEKQFHFAPSEYRAECGYYYGIIYPTMEKCPQCGGKLDYSGCDE